MKPIQFKGANVVYAKDQPEYIPLPAFKDESKEGIVVTCWELSFWDRVRLIFNGKLWLSIWTFNQPLQPVRPTTIKTDVLIEVAYETSQET